MKKEKKFWVSLLGGGGSVAAGIGFLIYTLFGEIEKTRMETETLRTKVATSRKLIQGTRTLEREVIVQREMVEVIGNILPDNEDMNNWVRTIQSFSDESGVRIRGLKKKLQNARLKKQTAFEEVTYSFTLEADTFQLLEYFNLVETHKRLMRVPTFKVTAARRGEVEDDGIAAHKVNVDIQTFVYEPQSDASTVRIDGYDRKRDLMVGEINRRRQDLSMASYSYRGTRARRDPFVDPRVLVEGGSALPVPEQIAIVQSMIDQMADVLTLYEVVKASENVLQEIVARADLEGSMGMLEESVRRVDAEGSITYLPAERRFQVEVVDALTALRVEMGRSIDTKGPSVDKLREVLEAMNRHFDFGEYALAIDAYRLVENELEYIENDPLRKPFVVRLRSKALVARIVLEFEDMPIDVDGVAIMAGAPSVAHINGQSLSEGDTLGDQLLINEIRTNEIEFIYRGVVLARRF